MDDLLCSICSSSDTTDELNNSSAVLATHTSNTNTSDQSDGYISSSSNYSIDTIDDGIDRIEDLLEHNEQNITLREQLRQWAIDHHITHAAIRGILSFLSPLHPCSPTDPRTLLELPVVPNIITIDNGSYYYVGIKYNICQLIQLYPCINQRKCISLQANVDGLPLFRSSSTQLWPILGRVKGAKPFVIALFCGNTKPNIQEYLKDFVTELKVLMTGGLLCEQKHYVIKLEAIICDAPAKCFTKQSKQYSGYEGRKQPHGLYF